MIYGEKMLFSFCSKERSAEVFSARPCFVQKLRQGTKFNAGSEWGDIEHLTAAEAIYKYFSEEREIFLKNAHIFYENGNWED